MGLELEREALRRLVSLDAQRSAMSSIGLAQERVGARAAALLALDGAGDYVVVTATELSQIDLDNIAGAWKRARTRLRLGEVLVVGGWALAPFGSPAVGLLYLGGAPDLTSERMELLTRQLSQILEAAVSERAAPSFDPDRLTDEPMARGRVARHRLLLILEYNGWNKARVARRLKITRPTLYRWMRIHGIRDPRE